MTMICIIPATQKHLPDISQIESFSAHPSWTQQQFAEALAHKQNFWVIQSNQEVIGFLLWQQILDEAEIYNIAITPLWRKKGMADKLMSHFLSNCQKHHIKKIFLEVRASNQSAQSLYLKHGFIKTHERKAYYRTDSGRENAWIMEYNVNHNG